MSSAIVRYRPPAMRFENAEICFSEGRKHINPNSTLEINASNLEDSSTAAVCAFIEWKREAQKKNCRLIFCNIPPRLRDLIKLYQLSDLFSS